MSKASVFHTPECKNDQETGIFCLHQRCLSNMRVTKAEIIREKILSYLVASKIPMKYVGILKKEGEHLHKYTNFLCADARISESESP